MKPRPATARCSSTAGGIYNVRIRDIFFDGRDTGGYGAGSLRIKSQRGRGVRLFAPNPTFIDSFSCLYCSLPGEGSSDPPLKSSCRLHTFTLLSPISSSSL